MNRNLARFLSGRDDVEFCTIHAPTPLAAPGANAPATRAPPPSSSTVALPQSPSAAPKTSIGSHRRWSRPHFIHQSFFEYANQSVLHCAWAKLFVQEKMAKGKKYPTAVHALAFKWQRIMFICWRDRVAYDETTYLNSLKHRGSPLAAKLDLHLPEAA